MIQVEYELVYDYQQVEIPLAYGQKSFLMNRMHFYPQQVGLLMETIAHLEKLSKDHTIFSPAYLLMIHAFGWMILGDHAMWLGICFAPEPLIGVLQWEVLN